MKEIKVLFPVSYIVNKGAERIENKFNKEETIEGKTIEEIKSIFKKKFEEKIEGFQCQSILVEYNGQSYNDDKVKVAIGNDLNSAKALNFQVILVKKEVQPEVPKACAKNYKAAARSFLAVSKFVTTVALIVENEFMKKCFFSSMNDLIDILRSNIFMTRSVLLGGGALIGLGCAYKSYHDKETSRWPVLGTGLFLIIFAAAAVELSSKDSSLSAAAKVFGILGISVAVELIGMVGGSYLNRSTSVVEDVKSGYYQGSC